MIPRLLLAYSLAATVLTMSGETIFPEGKPVNIIVWICPDPYLREITFNAVSQSSNTNEIVHTIQSQVQGYRSQMWSVTAVKYKRSTADMLPGRGITSQNLCFISVDKQDTVVVIAAIAPLLN